MTRTSGSARSNLRVAIVHDWLTNMAGQERVTLVLHDIFPQAPVYTSVYNADALPLFKGVDVRTSFMQRIPLARRKHQLFPLLRAWAFSAMRLRDYDVVLSVTTAEAKGVRVQKPGIHICYCNTPTRYYWSHYEEYKQEPGFGALNPVIRLVLPLMVGVMKRWDYRAAQRPDYMIGNSSAVVARIKKYYDRDAVVIHPPVDTKRFAVGAASSRRGFVMVGRQVPYKRFDLGVQACTELGIPLVVLGDGPMHDQLVAMAGDCVTFDRHPTDEAVAAAYAAAEGMIFPQEEDFGIVAVEALASGTPVVAFRVGGALDIVQENVNGVFFDTQDVTAVKQAITRLQKHTFVPSKVAATAEQFSHAEFERKLRDFIDTVVPKQ